MRIVRKTVTQKDKQVGFTLVEIILSLGLTALLLGLLSSGVYIVADDWNRNSDVLDKSLDQALAVLQIDRALARCCLVESECDHVRTRPEPQRLFLKSRTTPSP